MLMLLSPDRLLIAHNKLPHHNTYTVTTCTCASKIDYSFFACAEFEVKA